MHKTKHPNKILQEKRATSNNRKQHFKIKLNDKLVSSTRINFFFRCNGKKKKKNTNEKEKNVHIY